MIGRRTRLLSNVFFGRLFENDIFSSSVAASASVTWMLAALATPGVMMSGSLMFYYAHTRTMPPDVQDRALLVNQAFHIDFVMAMAGLVTMLVWSSLTPDRRDALVLGPLPLLAGEQARARLLALVRFFAIFIAAVSVPTAVAFTFVTVGPADVLAVPQRVAAHITPACAVAALWVCLVPHHVHDAHPGHVGAPQSRTYGHVHRRDAADMGSPSRVAPGPNQAPSGARLRRAAAATAGDHGSLDVSDTRSMTNVTAGGARPAHRCDLTRM